MTVHFTPPGLASEGFVWNVVDPTDEYVAALVTLGAAPFSKISGN